MGAISDDDQGKEMEFSFRRLWQRPKFFFFFVVISLEGDYAVTARATWWLLLLEFKSSQVTPVMQNQVDEAALQPPLSLSLSLISTFKPSKVFKDNTRPISSLSFDDSGELCVTSSSDESIHIYNCRQGKSVCLRLRS